MLTEAPIWKMSCKQCRFLGHHKDTGTDWYLNDYEIPKCLLVKYGDEDWEYDFHVYIHYTDELDEVLLAQVTHPEALKAAWEYIKENLNVESRVA